jgi:ribosomal peptide maturation radical SAM protein 1
MTPGPTPVRLVGRRANPEAARPLRVALVAMPFASVTRPSIQICLLKAIAERRGHDVETLHLTVDFVQELHGWLSGDAAAWYGDLTEERTDVGDWLFSAAAFGDDAPDPALMLDHLEQSGALETETTRDELLELSTAFVPHFLDVCLEATDWGRFDVVGFTSTFQQNVSSFALARRLRERHPDLTLVFGGANFDAGMGAEWVRSMPFIDYAVQGEADESFPALLDALGRGDDPLTVPGVLGRRDGDVVGVPAEPVSRLDDSPVPDYTEFFERVERLGPVHRLRISVPYESARGWGAKRHCTFCGLNGQTMAFRSKSQGRVLREITQLALKHRVLNFNAVDNIIDMAYFDKLLPELAAKNRPFRLFYETKADLDRTQIELMVRAGVDHIQPGIESLSSQVLGLMRKGTRAVWNVNLLRWGRYYGLEVYWNLIWGFPGEREADAAGQLEVLDRLRHLQPPDGAGRVWMERFSPLFTETDNFVATRLEPSRSYAMVYPAHVDLAEAAYFFDYHLDDSLPDEVYEPLTAAVLAWMEAAKAPERPTLTVADDPAGGALGGLVVEDRRDPLHPRTVRLQGPAARVHRAIMEHWRSRSALLAELGMHDAELDGALAELDRHRLVFVDGNLFVALALPQEPPAVTARKGPVWRSTPLDPAGEPVAAAAAPAAATAGAAGSR